MEQTYGTAIRALFTGDWEELAGLVDELVGGGELEQAATFDDEPEVILHACDGDGLAGELSSIRRHCDAPILLVATARGELLLERALAGGAVDVLLVDPELPETAVESISFAVRKAVLSGRWRPDELRTAQVFTVFSPKGGTGKSATATNLAVALQRHCGKRVLLVDLDVQFGDVAIMLGLEPTWTLHDVVASPGELDAGKLEGFTLRHASGLDVLAAPTRPEEAEMLTEEKVARLFDLALGIYDAIVVDTSPYFHGPMLVALDRTDQLLLLSGPDMPTLKNLRLVRDTLEQLSFPLERIRLVLNRAGMAGGVDAGELAAALELPVAFVLPDDPAVPTAVNRGKPALLVDADAPFATAVRGLAGELVGLEDAPLVPTSAVRRVRLALPNAVPQRLKAKALT
jgi:pilus assembly protein CpaE